MLTEEGQSYDERCVRTLDEIRTGEAAIDSGRRDAVGRLRVSMPVLFGRRCLAPVLTRLAAEHSKLELDLSFNDRPVDLVEDGFDLAIRNGEIGDGIGLMARTVGLRRMTVCAAPDYLERHDRPESLDDLPTHQAITYGRPGRIKAWRFPGEGRDFREVTPPSRLRFDDLEAISDAAEAGHGLACLPCWLIRERIRCGPLVPLLAAVPLMVFSTYALWPETPHLPVRVRFALDALAASLPGSAEL